jgi:Na+/H+-translocating membrane pyrophosphatase
MRRLKEKKKIDYNEEDMKKLEEKLKHFEENKDDLEANEIHHLHGKHLKMYKKAENASITGDTVGDPMKDTSGPSLNILIKLSSIISVVFGTLFVNTSYLVN